MGHQKSNKEVNALKENSENKMSDKAFNRLIFTSVLSIVLCLVLLCSTTYAWFADGVTQGGNEIKAANECLLSVTVTKNGESTPLENIESGVTLNEGATYRVDLSLPKDSSSGYCIISVGANQYFSEYLTRHDSDAPKTLTFYVKCDATFDNVTFTSHWGIYSRDCDVYADNTLVIS